MVYVLPMPVGFNPFDFNPHPQVDAEMRAHAMRQEAMRLAQEEAQKQLQKQPNGTQA